MESQNRVATLHGALRQITAPEHTQSKCLNEASPDVSHLLALLDSIEPRDVGLSLDVENDASNTTRDGVAYVPVVETPRYHVGLFVLGPRAAIPLHDHPGMTVLSRVLRGSVRVSSFDVFDSSEEAFSSRRQRQRRRLRAVAHAPVDLNAPCAAVALFPERRNLHEFVAGPLGTAILDVIVPPYDAHRGCTYYTRVLAQDKDKDGEEDDDDDEKHDDARLAAESAEMPCDAESQRLVHLRVADPEPDFSCVTLEYAGLPP